jgi:secreted trypsin-like serine protease
VNQLDALHPGSATTFTSVGYGVQRINPVQEVAALIRMVAQPHLVQMNTGFTGTGSLLLSNNAATGGTCFGDSGGPNYLGSGNVVAGVTSFGLNGSCGGTGGVFRVDRKDVVDFVSTYLK